MAWPRLEENSEDWQRFLKRLWTYQYLRDPVELTPDLSRALYYETQGVPDFVVKLFVLAQMRAIAAKQERLTAALIVSAARDFLALARPLLKALRDNDDTALKRYEDLEPPDLAAQLERVQATLNMERTTAALASLDAEDGTPPSNATQASFHSTPIAEVSAMPTTPEPLPGGEQAPEPVSPPLPAASKPRSPRKSKRAKSRPEPTPGSLQAIVLASPGTSRYDALWAAGLVFPLEPYFSSVAR